jgi:tetratricopeptide (TPR) repeat protein
MKIIIIWSLFILSATVWAQADDYFDCITVYSEGRITRFSEMPILVYAEPALEVPEWGGPFLDDVKYTLNEWEIASKGNIKFELTKDRTKANIGVMWSQRSLMDMIDDSLGEATIIRQSDTSFRVEMTLFLRSKGSNQLLTHEQMRAICLHEFGHALGLWGHSEDTEDVMYFAPTAQHPTARDINTLMKVYELEPNYSQHEQAISVLKSKIEKNPKSARLQYLLGSVYLDKGDYDAAINTFIYCLELDLFNKEAGNKLVHAYLRSGRKEDALKQCDKLLEIDPSIENYNAAGVLYYKQGQVEQAIRYFEKALQIDPRYPMAKNNLYNLYREQGLKGLENQDYDTVVSFYKQALKLVSNDSILYTLLGEAYSQKNDYRSAIEQYNKAYQFNPGNTEAKNNLARCYNNLGVQLQNDGRWLNAIANYKKAYELMPEENQFKNNLASAHSGLAAQLFNEKNYPGAIEQWHLSLTYNSNQKEIHSNIGGAYFQLGNYPEAIKSFKTTLELDPEYTEAKSNLVATYQQYAQSLDKQRRYHDAIVQLQHALEIEPDNVNTHLLLGYSCYHTRNYSDAIGELEKIPVEFRSVDIDNIMGYSYMQLKRFPNAIAQFDKVLLQKPTDEMAYKNLEYIEFTLKGQLEKNDSSEVRDNLALAKCSLAVGLLSREEEISAKAKLREALDLKPIESAVKQKLVSTCLKLAEAFKKEEQQQNAKEVAQWVLELDSENEQAKQILGQG